VLSLRDIRKAANMPETRMNTACLCRSVSLYVWPSQFALGNGMEEVAGSIPARSTKSNRLFSDRFELPFKTTSRKIHPQRWVV
jgi:hypothetical protein